VPIIGFGLVELLGERVQACNALHAQLELMYEDMAIVWLWCILLWFLCRFRFEFNTQCPCYTNGAVWQNGTQTREGFFADFRPGQQLNHLGATLPINRGKRQLSSNVPSVLDRANNGDFRAY
jgi:hypothetical protein